jgi:peptide-methionine (R)-S-oxide reductase
MIKVNDEDTLPASEKEWKSRLGDDAWRVLRKEGTEPPFSSALNDEHRKGTFACAGCGRALFESDAKFDSGTGWPSFFKAIEGAVETRRDFKLILPRVEYHCAHCGGHQGHVFDDGPEPTGKRFCNNGLALRFVPNDE